MFQVIKKILFSMVFALMIGLLSLFIFNLTQAQVMMTVILVAIVFFVVTSSKKLSSEIVSSKKSDSTDEQYRLLEKKFKAISEKADKLEYENKSTELFLASMSHEIRTPLNGIIGLTEVLDDTPLTEEQKEFVSLIRESSNNLRVIVNDILDVSKMNAGKMELESIAFDLFKKVEASVGIFRSKINDKEISLKIFIDPMIPKEVIGDPTRLSQVIINLVSNALKFTDKGGTISVSSDYVGEEDNTVTFKISVSDSGIGMTEEQLQNIFEAYSQAESSTNRKFGGTGLGLMISRKIIASMDGELEVESEEGKGSTFFFILTLEKVEQKTEALHEEEIEDAVELEVVLVKEGKKGFADLSVLVAEDNPINQKLIKIVLENLGLSVTLASDGQEAYDKRIATQYDMIFMDIQMPVMGGIESTHSILQYEKDNNVKHIPIIALTANALPGDREKYISEGMDDYATKPLDIKILENLITHYCNVEQ